MIFSNDFFICSGIVVKINHQLSEDSALIVLPAEEKVLRRSHSASQYLQVPQRNQSGLCSGAVVMQKEQWVQIAREEICVKY